MNNNAIIDTLAPLSTSDLSTATGGHARPAVDPFHPALGGSAGGSAGSGGGGGGGGGGGWGTVSTRELISRPSVDPFQPPLGGPSAGGSAGGASAGGSTAGGAGPRPAITPQFGSR